MKVVVFLGPSLTIDVAREILPDAIFLPPAQQSDVLSAVRIYQPDVIGLIDGVFGQSLPVWHKEILFALEQGIRVLGAASMGALRAAELADFGMEGAGEIFCQYRTGTLQDDDEVALVHASAEDGYTPLTEPMVNVRATLARGRAEGVVTEVDHDEVVAAAKRLHFSQRALSTILAEAQLGCSARDSLRDYFRTRYVDVKAADARLLLEAVREPPDAPASATKMVRSRAFEVLYNNDRRVRRECVEVPIGGIVTYAALHEPDFDAVNFGALNHELAQVLAGLLQLEPTQADIDAEYWRFRRERGLQNAAELDDWLRANDMTADELRALVRELAVCRRLHRWLLGSPRAAHRSRWLLDELRVRGRYPAVAEAAARLAKLEQACGGVPDGLAEVEERVQKDLVPGHQRATGWRLHTDIAEWAEEAGFGGLKDLAYELLRERRLRAFANLRGGDGS